MLFAAALGAGGFCRGTGGFGVCEIGLKVIRGLQLRQPVFFCRALDYVADDFKFRDWNDGGAGQAPQTALTTAGTTQA